MLGAFVVCVCARARVRRACVRACVYVELCVDCHESRAVGVLVNGFWLFGGELQLVCMDNCIWFVS